MGSVRRSTVVKLHSLLVEIEADMEADVEADVEFRVTAKWPYMIHQIVHNHALNPNKP